MERCVGKPNLTARLASPVPGTAPVDSAGPLWPLGPAGVLLIAGSSLAPLRLASQEAQSPAPRAADPWQFGNFTRSHFTRRRAVSAPNLENNELVCRVQNLLVNFTALGNPPGLVDMPASGPTTSRGPT